MPVTSIFTRMSFSGLLETWLGLNLLSFSVLAVLGETQTQSSVVPVRSALPDDWRFISALYPGGTAFTKTASDILLAKFQWPHPLF